MLNDIIKFISDNIDLFSGAAVISFFGFFSFKFLSRRSVNKYIVNQEKTDDTINIQGNRNTNNINVKKKKST